MSSASHASCHAHHRGRSVGLGETVEVGDVEAHLRHPFDDRARRRRASGRHLDDVPEPALDRVRRVQQQVEHDRRATHVGYPVLLDEREDQRGVDGPQAHVGAPRRGHSPGVRPAVAVEHRQRPQVARPCADAECEHLSHRVEVCTPVVAHDALGVAGRARRVAEADRLPLVVREAVVAIRRSLVEECFVVLLSDQVAALAQGIVDVDHDRRCVHPFERLCDHWRELAIGDQHLRLGVAEDEPDRVGVQPVVQRVEHRAAHRHPEVRLEQLGDIRRHQRDGVADADAASRQRSGEAPAARVELRVGVPAGSVHDGRLVGVDHGRSLQKADRRERHEVRGPLVESSLVGVAGSSHLRHCPVATAIRNFPAAFSIA